MIIPRLSSRGHLLLVLSQLLLLLLLKKLLLSLSIEALEFKISLQLLSFLSFQVSLLGLLLLVCLLQLTDRIFTGGANLAQDFGTEMSSLDKSIGKANEILEERKEIGIIAGGWKSHGEVDALLGNSFLKPENVVSFRGITTSL
jgi:hypothetical protein